jgi:hypothetical protein
MSRSHLYRATNPARPIAAVVLASVWAGAALCLLVATGGALFGDAPLIGPAAAFVERASMLLAVGAVVVGLASLVRDLLVGRTVMRLPRLVGAALLLVAGGAGLVDTLPVVLRPGTPVASAAPPEAGARNRGATAGDAQGALWTALGLAGAALVVGGGVAALRSREGLL